MVRQFENVWRKAFCTFLVWTLFCGVCFATVKETRQAMAPEKPSATAGKGANKTGASEKKGRVPKEEPSIRVGLSDGQASAVLTADDAYVVRDAATGQGLDKFAGKAMAAVTVKGRQLAVNGKAISAKSIRFSMADSRTMR